MRIVGRGRIEEGWGKEGEKSMREREKEIVVHLWEVTKWMWLLFSSLIQTVQLLCRHGAHPPLNSARFKSLNTLILKCFLCHCFDYSVTSEKQILCICNNFQAVFFLPYYHLLLYVFIAIDYIVYLQKQSTRQTEKLEKLQREVKALDIMKE